MSTPPPGRLLLVPNALDHGTGQTVALDELLPQAVMVLTASLRHWVVEDAKSARAFLQRVAVHAPLAQPLQSLGMQTLPRSPKGAASAPPDAAVLDALLAPALQGHDLGLLSEAGMPAVADPGAALVARAHARGVPVRPLVGPSSLLLALAASGLNGQHFAFAGYLPVEAAARSERIRHLESVSARAAQTQLVIETPYRNAALWAGLQQTLQPHTRLAVAQGLTLPQARCAMHTVAQWRQLPPWAFAERLPAVFGWLAG